MTTLAMVEELRGNLGRALQLIGEGVRLADDSPRREGHQDPLHVVQGSILMELDRLQDARSTLQAGMRVSEELGAHWHLPFYEAYLAMEWFLAGGWDDASAELDAALQLVAATGERHSLVLIESLSSLIALHRGDQRHAEEAVARAERLARLAAGGEIRIAESTWRLVRHAARTSELPDGGFLLHDIDDDAPAIATFDTDSLFDYRARRPTLDIVDGRLALLTWPELAIRRVRVSERDLLEALFAGKEEEMFARLTAEAQAAIDEDGADVILLGSTTMHQAGDYMSAHLAAPVINPGPVAIKMAEVIVGLGLSHSKVAFPTPDTIQDEKWFSLVGAGARVS